jgi:hypothetical protein
MKLALMFISVNLPPRWDDMHNKPYSGRHIRVLPDVYCPSPAGCVHDRKYTRRLESCWDPRGSLRIHSTFPDADPNKLGNIQSHGPRWFDPRLRYYGSFGNPLGNLPPYDWGWLYLHNPADDRNNSPLAFRYIHLHDRKGMAAAHVHRLMGKLSDCD